MEHLCRPTLNTRQPCRRGRIWR